MGFDASRVWGGNLRSRENDTEKGEKPKHTHEWDSILNQGGSSLPGTANKLQIIHWKTNEIRTFIH